MLARFLLAVELAHLLLVVHLARLLLDGYLAWLLLDDTVLYPAHVVRVVNGNIYFTLLIGCARWCHELYVQYGLTVQLTTALLA